MLTRLFFFFPGDRCPRCTVPAMFRWGSSSPTVTSTFRCLACGHVEHWSRKPLPTLEIRRSLDGFTR